ncbi:MAG: hexitol phosphatase HxpB [Alphaproteobacteria bacterium]|nr:hexitol phosphatase HxpB [Alphaproteobacteria bacterium]
MGGGIAAIFDMDGLLVDSEPLWVRAEIEVFATVGVSLSPDDCATTTGLRIDRVAAHWHRLRPWPGPGPDAVAAAIVDRMEQLLSTEAAPLPGVAHALRLVGDQGARLALASSSSPRLIDATLGRLGLSDTFEVVRSAAAESHGKPHPAVYLSTAAALGLDPTRCIAFEDSLNGIIAAKAASMGCIAVPEARRRFEPAFRVADMVLPSLATLTADAWRTVLRHRGLV